MTFKLAGLTYKLLTTSQPAYLHTYYTIAPLHSLYGRPISFSSTCRDFPLNLVKYRLVTWLLESRMDYLLISDFHPLSTPSNAVWKLAFSNSPSTPLPCCPPSDCQRLWFSIITELARIINARIIIIILIRLWDMQWWMCCLTDGLVDCVDPDCCISASCRDSLHCRTAPEPMEILLRKQPPSSSASFYERMRFLIEDNSVQSYATVSSFNQRFITVSVIITWVSNMTVIYHNWHTFHAYFFCALIFRSVHVRLYFMCLIRDLTIAIPNYAHQVLELG